MPRKNVLSGDSFNYERNITSRNKLREFFVAGVPPQSGGCGFGPSPLGVRTSKLVKDPLGGGGPATWQEKGAGWEPPGEGGEGRTGCQAGPSWHPQICKKANF